MGHSLVFMPECHSTNDEASRLIQNMNVIDGTVIITNNQIAGRGQRGNTWLSAVGKNLTFSILLKPSFVLVKDQFYLNVAFSLGLADYLKVALKTEVKIKWPNDILIGNKKICGILIENHIHGQHIQHSIVGIGLNVNQEVFATLTATSMSLQRHSGLLLEEVLHDLLGYFETRYLQLRAGQVEALIREYHYSLYWMDENRIFKNQEDIFEGKISGVDASGRLVIITNGLPRHFEVKQIQFLK